jgi:hypothetical protein
MWGNGRFDAVFMRSDGWSLRSDSASAYSPWLGLVVAHFIQARFVFSQMRHCVCESEENRKVAYPESLLRQLFVA